MLKDICSEWRFEGEQAPVRESKGGLLQSREQRGLSRQVSKGAGTGQEGVRETQKGVSWWTFRSRVEI